MTASGTDGALLVSGELALVVVELIGLASKGGASAVAAATIQFAFVTDKVTAYTFVVGKFASATSSPASAAIGTASGIRCRAA